MDHRSSEPQSRYVAPDEKGTFGVFALIHPNGLRALPKAREHGLEGVHVLQVGVTVQHLLECRALVEAWIADPSLPALALRLEGPLSFSDEVLARIAQVTVAQVETATRLLRVWSTRSPGRLTADFEGTFAVLSPTTTRTDLRKHLDGLARHELAVDPIAMLSAATPLEPTFADDVAAIVDRVGGVQGARERIAALARALDAPPATGARGRKRRLRLLPSSRERASRTTKVQEVRLSRACNLACGYCDAVGPDDRSGRQRAADAIVQVREAVRAGAEILVLGGAEPTLEWYLEDLVRLAGDLGVRQIVLETNAVELADRARAEALAEAGLSTARVALGSFAPAVSDAITGAAGALARTLAGARALLDAGVAVELAVALLPENAGELARIVEQVASALPASRAKVERVVARAVRERPDGGRTLSTEEIREALEQAARAAARGGVPVEVSPGSELPPCVFDDVQAVEGVLRLSEGLVARGEPSSMHTRIAVCDGCGASHVCPGPVQAVARDVARLARPLPIHAPGIPPTEERRQVLREMRSVILRKAPDGSVVERRVLRVNFHCNQACDFCFVSRQLPAPEEELIEAELREAASHRAALALSGGEPTLNPRLPFYVARAVELGITDLELQTNALKMSDRAYAAELAAAGLRLAFVSLHGTTAATSDRVTSAPGTFERTVAGIRNLLREGVRVRANFVVCGYNARELAALPDYVARELRSSGAADIDLNFSFVAPSSNVPRDVALVPRFSEVAWALDAALAGAEAHGIALHGFDSQCGVPPCFLPRAVRESAFTEDLPDEELRAFGSSFRKSPGCADCAFTRRCYGVRAGYAEMYGTGELVPVSR